MENRGDNNICVRLIRLWRDLMVVNFKTGGGFSSRESVAKWVLAGDGCNAKGSL